MDLNKAQLLLDKINRLYKSMSLDPENVAPIEKDLMKDYIKMLYSTFLEDSPVLSQADTTTIQPKQVRRNAVDHSEVYQPPREVSRPTVTTTRPPTKRTLLPNELVEESTPVRTVSPRVTMPPKEERIVEIPHSIPTPSPRASVPSSRPLVINEEEEQLFTLESGTELSHKLGSLPISDLNKAMGINERIFTINELFRGDSRAFKHTINELNKLSSFADAKTYLAKNVVTPFDWTNKQRRNKAKNFIKLVRRRYL